MPSEVNKALSDHAWAKLAENEANALALLLEREDRKIMVVVVAADTDTLGTTHVLHAVSSGTHRAHGVQFATALLKKADFIQEKLK